MVNAEHLKNALAMSIDDEATDDNNINKVELDSIRRRFNILVNQLEKDASEPRGDDLDND